MLEVEAKVRLGAGGAGALRRRLRELGAAPAPPESQEDTYFAHPARDLAASDEALRLRRTPAGFELTYKGPRQPGLAVKARREVTVRLAEDPTPLLEALGHLPAARVRKVRVPWRLEGAEVALDDVEGLGAFAEVEVQAEDARAAAARVESLLARLGLEGAERVAASYLEMLGAATRSSS